jgi:hypothetical protein
MFSQHFFINLSFLIKLFKGQIATQPENFNNTDLQKLSQKMANTTFLPDCHLIT